MERQNRGIEYLCASVLMREITRHECFVVEESTTACTASNGVSFVAVGDCLPIDPWIRAYVRVYLVHEKTDETSFCCRR